MTSYIVNKADFFSNIEKLSDALNPGTVLWAVVKGNGYGLGIEQMTSLLLEKGIQHFAVTTIQEAKVIRSMSEAAEILLLRPIRETEELNQLLVLNVIATIGSREDAENLSAAAAQQQMPARAHCKIDTGMGRYGFSADEINEVVSLYNNPSIQTEGIYTHFHSAFCNQKETEKQFANFSDLLKKLSDAGINPGMRHCCNSSAALRYPQMHLDAVRIGSALLGRISVSNNLNLTRIGYCEATIDSLHTLNKRESTGYGAGWRAKRTTTLAIIPIGYFHGFGAEYGRDLFRLRDCLRSAVSSMLAAVRKKQITVEIQGQNYPVRGHIGMLHTAIDITGSDIKAGDLVKLNINPLLMKQVPVVIR